MLDITERPRAASHDLISNIDTAVSALCKQCGKAFTARAGTGGRPQRFCSAECRTASHAGSQGGSQHQNGQQKSQRNVGETPTSETLGTLLAKTKPAPEHTGDFDWSRDDDGVVLREQYATAIYHNPNGELVIRQKRWPDDDQCIFIAPEALDTFIDQLTDIIGIPAVGRP